MCRDEEFYESSNSFNPDRYLDAHNMQDDDTKSKSDKTLRADDPQAIIFGFGRR
jgi:hypothetical protein